MDDWIKRMRYIFRMEYYSAMRKNEILPFTTTYIDFESIILSEISKMENNKNHIISTYVGYKTENK